MRPSNNLEKKIPSDTYWRGLWLVCMKVQVLWSTTGVKSASDASGKLRLVMTFLANLGVILILCFISVVLERITGKEILESSRFELLEMFLANNSVLSDPEDNTSGPLNRVSLADLPPLRTLLAICQVPRAQFLGSDRLYCFSSICMFGSFKNSFAMMTSLSELYFRFRRSVLLAQTKTVISMSYGSSTSSTSSWKPWSWVRLNLVYTMSDTYINSNDPIFYQICDIMMSISTWDRKHFWIDLLNHNSLTHKICQLIFLKSFTLIWRTGAMVHALFNLTTCSNYSTNNYVKFSVFHFFERVNTVRENPHLGYIYLNKDVIA